MSFVGVICDTKFENYIRQTLKQLGNKNVIIFSNENIENLKNIKFEIVIVMSKHNISNKKEILKNIIENVKYLVINVDEELDLDILKGMNLNVITYGFNSKSTITTSSVENENIMLCVQRNIKNCKGEEIEPQEISIQKTNAKMPTNITLGLATVLILSRNERNKTIKNYKKMEKINFLCRQNQKNVV